MQTRYRNNILSSLVAGMMAISALSLAADDPSIKGDLRNNIKASMNQYIEGQTFDGSMYLFDSTQGKLLKMQLVELHDGIVKKGGFYVSCADFRDHNDRLVDIDFMVRPRDGQLITTQAIVHSIDGKKRKYHLEKL